MTELAYPPSDEVAWLCMHAATHQCCTVLAQTWFFARQKGAAMLGVPLSEVEAVLESDQ